jgi:hypothetical protein
MKILFTGASNRHIKREIELSSKSINRINDSEIIVEVLESLGHIVEKRKIFFGENLSNYDRIIVGLGSFSTFTYSSEIINCLYALSYPNSIIFNEGKKVIDRFNGYSKITKTILSKKLKNGEYFYNQPEKLNYDLILDILSDILNGKYKIILPSFKWGDKSILEKIFNTNRIFYADISPYVLNKINIDLNYKNNYKKINKHFFSSLENFNCWIKKEKLKWPIDLYGPGTKNKSLILNSELDVFLKSGQYKSILAPAYDTEGSGWFKMRYVYSALNNSCVTASNKDLKALGVIKWDVEHLSNKMYNKYSQIQKEKILSYIPTMEEFSNELNKFITTI